MIINKKDGRFHFILKAAGYYLLQRDSGIYLITSVQNRWT